MDELEGRLQTLTRLSPPTTDELGADVLHERATRVRRRSQLALAVPAAALVVVVLAAALALRTRTPADETVPAGPPESVSAGSGLTPRDLERLDWVESSLALRDELVLEMLASATYASTNKGGSGELAAQRTKTDAAAAAFEAKSQQFGVDREGQALRDAQKQFLNRMRSLPTIRRSVDAIQTEAPRLVDDYTSTIMDLSSMERGLLSEIDDPPLFRGLFNQTNLTAVTNLEARTAALLSVALDTGYYAAVLPTGEVPTAARDNALGEGCGQDAASAGDNCKLFKDAVGSNTDMAVADKTFEDFATGNQKQLKRAADAGQIYDELKRNAIEDGQGHNDLTGGTPGSRAVQATDFRLAAQDRLAALGRAERQLLHLIRFPNGPGPTGPDAYPPGISLDPQNPNRTTTTVPVTMTTTPAAPTTR